MKKKLLALFLCLAVALTFGTVSSVFATQNTDGTMTGKTVAVTKELKVGEGITLPTETFSFDVKKGTTNTTFSNLDEYISDTNDYYNLSFTGITVQESDRGSSTPEVIVKESSVDLTNATFGCAGLFVYEIKENSTAGTTGMDYDNSTYYLKVYVKNSANGPVVDQVGIADENGNKVDGTPVATNPGGNQLIDESKESDGAFRFVNTFTKTVTTHSEPANPNPDPTPSDNTVQGDTPGNINETNLTDNVAGAFVLDKFVLGEYGDQTKDFSFSVTVTLPSTAASFNLNRAADAQNNVTSTIPTVTNGTISSGDWANNTAKEVTLKHEGKLVFPELPVGTKITVVENDYTGDGYTAYNTSSLNPDSLTNILVGENGGYAIVRNNFDDASVTPTGIIINNLPYILLILFALGGIVLFVRKRRYE